MIKTTFAELVRNKVLEEDDVDPGSWDGYAVADGYALEVMEGKFAHSVTMIQRVFDVPDQRDNLFCIDADGSTVYTSLTNDLTVRLYKEINEISC